MHELIKMFLAQHNAVPPHLIMPLCALL